MASTTKHAAGSIGIDGHCLSLRLSVTCLTLSQEWKGLASWNLAERKSRVRSSTI